MDCLRRIAPPTWTIDTKFPRYLWWVLALSFACGSDHGLTDAPNGEALDAPEAHDVRGADSASACLEGERSETACDDACDDDGNGYTDCVDFACVWDQPRATCEDECRACGDLTLCRSGLSELESNPSFMTWNIREFDGTPAVASRVAQVLSDLQPGVVALREIASSEALRSVLECASGYTHFLTSNNNRYKVALLIREDRFRIQEVFEVPMLNHRPLLGATLMKQDGTLFDVYAVHLWPGAESYDTERRRSQMSALARFIDARPARPVVILGDFNELLTDPVRSRAFDELVGAPVFAAPVPSADPSLTSTIIGRDDLDLDHILSTSGLERSQILRLEGVFHGYGARMSDHRPVLAW